MDDTMFISFNIRLRYKEAEDCIEKIRKLGGNGNITIGGSCYEGTKDQIDDLLKYMSEKDYDMESLAINMTPREASEKRFENAKNRFS